MIVVDVNIIAYGLMQGPLTTTALQVRQKDPAWHVPALWRHEFLNILATAGESGWAEGSHLISLWRQSVGALSRFERVSDMERALHLATKHKISAYDAQYVGLAEILDVPLVTEDRRLQRTFPKIALSMNAFLAN